MFNVWPECKTLADSVDKGGPGIQLICADSVWVFLVSGKVWLPGHGEKPEHLNSFDNALRSPTAMISKQLTAVAVRGCASRTVQGVHFVISTPAFLITFAHFLVSDSMKARKCFGLSPATVRP